MAATGSSSSQSYASWPHPYPADADTKHNLVKQIRRHEVAITELTSLQSTRPVYQKFGNIFFRTTVQKAAAYEQRELDLARARREGGT